MTYEYENLTLNGYIKFNIPKKEHNKIFKDFKLTFFEKAEYYYSKNHEVIVIQLYFNKFAIFLEVVLFPFSLLCFGLFNFKEMFNALKKNIYQKKYGYFIQNSLFKQSEEYSKILTLFNKGS